MADEPQRYHGPVVESLLFLALRSRRELFYHSNLVYGLNQFLVIGLVKCNTLSPEISEVALGPHARRYMKVI